MARARDRHAGSTTRAIVITAIAGAWLAASPAWASSSGWIHAPLTPFQLGLAPAGQQLFDEATSVYGLRLSLLYVTNKQVAGIDAGLFSDAAALQGLQLGLGNQVQGPLHGVQLGFANSADQGGGLQVGVLNRTHGMKGLQIGLVNWNDEGFLPVFPLFNFSVGHRDH